MGVITTTAKAAYDSLVTALSSATGIGAIPPALGVAAAGTASTLARTDHVHVMPRLDQVSAPTAAVAMNAQALTGLLDPVNPQDGSTKNYSDTREKVLGFWAMLSAPATAAVRFVDFGNVRDTPQAAEQSSAMVMPTAGTITKMFANHFNALSTDSITYTLRLNGADTAITCVVAATTTQANDVAHTVAYAAGDRLSVKCVQSSTQAGATLGASVSLSYKSP